MHYRCRIVILANLSSRRTNSDHGNGGHVTNAAKLDFLFHFTFVTSAMLLKQEKEDAEIKFGTSHLRLVGLLGGLESLSFFFFLQCSAAVSLMLRRPGMEVEPLVQPHALRLKFKTASKPLASPSNLNSAHSSTGCSI
jgi:hypothetical protein